MISPLTRAFFERDPVSCATGLVGCTLVWGRCSGIVVETEAYAAEGDDACHTFRRPSARRFVAGHPAGTAYVYLNYGMHWLANVLVKGDADGFVLLRAVEPVRGLGWMRRRRRIHALADLCSGPGRLAQAFGIDGRHHGTDLCARVDRGFWAREGMPPIAAGPRVGISLATALPWRFALAGSPSVSRPRMERTSPPGIS
jgi:DNA-3-methyladenine glycosylase